MVAFHPVSLARRCCLLVLGLLLVAPWQAASAGSDRVFADGFEPCCRIGGTVSGLTGSGLVLHLAAGAVSADQAISANGIYDFAPAAAPGSSYAVSILSQPAGQTCSLAAATGTVGTTGIDNVDVVCGGNLQWDAGNWGENWN